MTLEQPLVVTAKSDLRAMSIPPTTTQVHVTAKLTRAVYEELLEKIPHLKTILISTSSLRLILATIANSARVRGIEFRAASLIPANIIPECFLSPEFLKRKRVLETMDKLGRKRLKLLLKENAAAAHLLVARYGLNGSKPMGQKSLLQRNPNYRDTCQLSCEIAAAFSCLNPTHRANSRIRQRALQIYVTYLAKYELRSFIRQFELLAKKLKR